MAKWDNPIGIPFAESGDRTNIPDTSESGNVNNTTGFGNKYEVDPAVGGLWLYRQTLNSLFYNMFSSLKEIQTKVPISVNGEKPDASGNIPIIIPEADGAGIKVIDDNNTDITSFNQITENGVYYIYKQLSDGPSYQGEAIPYYYINLIVINVKNDEIGLNVCLQLTSMSYDGFTLVPGNIGVLSMARQYDKENQRWDDWYFRAGIPFIGNCIAIDGFSAEASDIKFPIIANDNDFDTGYNTFMYSATKEQMREQLGIKDEDDDVDKDVWTVYTPASNITNQRCRSAMYKIYNREINGFSYRCISAIAVISIDITINDLNLYSLTLKTPEGIKIYKNGTALKNGGMSSMIYSLNGMSTSEIGGTAVNVVSCYINSVYDTFYPSFALFTDAAVGSKISSAVITFQIDALIDDRQVAPTPATIAVTEIQGNSVTLTYTRGS